MLRVVPRVQTRFLTSQQGTSSSSPHEMAYAEERLIGYSRDQMFEVVSDVSSYRQFVPWCRRSDVKPVSPNVQLARLDVGFPPFMEKYTSRVTALRPVIVRSVCIEGESLFRRLETTFRFAEGVPGNEATCTLHYDLVFEFQSAFHRKIAHIFFDKVVRTMVQAFLDRAESLYGPPAIAKQDARIIKYKS